MAEAAVEAEVVEMAQTLTEVTDADDPADHARLSREIAEREDQFEELRLRLGRMNQVVIAGRGRERYLDDLIDRDD